MVPTCNMCERTLTQVGRGKPRRYCDACEPIGHAIRTIERALPDSPVALLGILAALEQVRLPAGGLTDAQGRRLRASAFVLGSRGRKLEPGSAGRYKRTT